MPAKISDILSAIKNSNTPISLAGLRGAAKGLVYSWMARHLSNRVIFIVTSTEERSLAIREECEAFAGFNQIHRFKIFPENSTLPYSRISPEPEAAADRLCVLDRLFTGEGLVIIASVQAAMRRVPCKEFIIKGSRTITIRQEIDPLELARFLTTVGYEDMGLVEDEGSFARRGGIIDIWSPSTDKPARIELDGNKVASIRNFDPASQRSKDEVQLAKIIPAKEFAFGEDSRTKAAKKIRARAEEMDLPTREWRPVVQAISEGIAFSGIDTFMPVFFDETATIFDYLPRDTIMAVDSGIDMEIETKNHEEALGKLAAETLSPEKIIHPDEIALSASEFKSRVGGYRGLIIDPAAISGEIINAGTEGNSDITALVHGKKIDEDILGPLATRIESLKTFGYRIVFVCHNELQAARLTDLFRLHGMELKTLDAPFDSVSQMTSATLHIILGHVTQGFKWPVEKLSLITDEEIFGSKVIRRPAPSRPMEPFQSLAELEIGDTIVHELHGIGRYMGLVHLSIEDTTGDYMLIKYLGGDKLYLPVYRLNQVGRYIGSGDGPPFLDKLGGMRWTQVRQKVDASIRLMAKELLDIYAARELYPGFPFRTGGIAYEEFAAAFPYDETPDQAKAIDDVLSDMAIERPMDRLICGDVGYGKTEVAMRAAYSAVLTGKQVAVLVPTTVLALQHFETFTKRFKDTAVQVDMLSRFKGPKAQKVTCEALSRGGVDIIIGTHRILQRDVKFRDLGLLIVDEEHRFGVRHKERIKKMKSSVDVMTLTATPIPRTLNFSLSGIRDVSIINTPPADRHSIATYVVEFDEGVIRGAIIKELARGGQIFFVHNRVETIGSMHERLKRLVPEARIVVGHGQMKEGELERVMIEFIERRTDVLLCTTIIESGLDISSANTIIINRADTFGLAELYQLRGRVGRSNVHAYAYLITPDGGEMTHIAKKRLTVLTRFTELGSGFQIAMHDLEFRGAGNILGSAQSGHIEAVGYEMYTRLLERAVRRLKGVKVEEEIDPELSLKVPAFLPEGYVREHTARIELYRRLSTQETAEEILELADEIRDRFGQLPPEAVNLMSVMDIRILAKKLRIKQITSDGKTISCQFDKSTPLGAHDILNAASKGDFDLRFVPPDRLLILMKSQVGDSGILAAVKNSLSMLIGYVSKSGE